MALRIVKNGFASNHDDERMNDFEEPYSELTGTQVSNAVAKFLSGGEAVVSATGASIHLQSAGGGPTLYVYRVTNGYALQLTASRII
jgi:hypothetical protein